MADTPPATATLDALRAEIDACDDALHALLMRRAAVVARLAASAAKPTGTVLRPGREAAILGRLLAAHRGALPPAALVRIWREVFASSHAQQADFQLAVAGGAAMERLAAAHFGVGTPQQAWTDAAAALAALAAGEAAVAVLPWPDAQEAAPWWPGLEAQVIARLPFLEDGPAGPRAAVVARYPADASGRDVTLFRLPRGAPAPAGARRIAEAAEAGLILYESEAEPPAEAAPLGRYALPDLSAPPGAPRA